MTTDETMLDLQIREEELVPEEEQDHFEEENILVDYDFLRKYEKEEKACTACDRCSQPMSEHDDGECPKNASEYLIEGYKDLTFEQCDYIFDLAGRDK